MNNVHDRAVSLRKSLVQVMSGTYRLDKIDMMLESELRVQDKLTRHACAERVMQGTMSLPIDLHGITDQVHRSVMSCNGG